MNPNQYYISQSPASLRTALAQDITNLWLPLQPSQAEQNTGVSIVQPWFPPGDMARYGLSPNNIAAAAGNATILQTLFNPAITNGPSGLFWFPNTTGADIYYLGAVIPCRSGIRLDIGGCTLSMGSSGTPVIGVAADSGSGLFMAQNDFSCFNGNITIFWSTGVSTSSGNAFQLGFRGSDSPRWPLNPVYDSALAVAQGGFKIEDVRITSTITGANANSASAIAITGGVQGLDFKNVYIKGNGTGGMGFGIVYEFGWATSGTVGDTGQSSRQSAHMHGANFENIVITNMDNVSAASNAMIITGAYGCFFKNIYISGCSNGIVCNPGEAQYFRPWTGVDDLGSKREMQFRNITVVGASSSGITIQGTSTPTSSTYLHVQWVALTVYVAGQTVKNGANMYVTAAGGTSGNTGGPTGTGSAIVEGSVTWAYVDLTKFTDLLDLSLDGFALSCTSTGNPLACYAGTAAITNGYMTGGSAPFISEETTRVKIEGVTVQGCGQAGLIMDFTASAVWSPARLKKGVIRNSYFAGNSTNSAGAFGAIQIKNFDGFLIEGCRFGYETAYSFIQETTQAQAILISSTTAGANANMLIRNCRVAGSVGGTGFANSSSSANQGCRAENNTYNAGGTNPVTTPLSGAWISDLESATAVAIGAAGTITTNAVTTSRVAPAGAVAGVVLQQGSYQGQTITVVNESVAASTITFAAAGTSHVADGVGDVIAGVTARMFRWDVATSLWYRMG